MTELEMKVNRLARQVRQTKKELEEVRQLLQSKFPLAAPGAASNKSRSKRLSLEDALRTAGLLCAPGEFENEMTKSWRRLSKRDQKAFRAELRAIKLEKPVSEIIIESRR
jgi:hypothetical protein